MGVFTDAWDKITAQPPTGKGSFRGVPFYIIDDSNQSGGFRLVKHEFPGRQAGKAENMGASFDDYSIFCVLIGDDYLEQKEALIAALKDPEPADLEHPYYGTVYAQIETWSCRLSTHEKRIALFQLTFCIADKEESPEVVINGEAELLDQQQSLLDALATDAAETWDSITGVAADIEAAMIFTTNTINNITHIVTGLSSLGGFNVLLGTVQGLQGSINHLIESPKKLLSDLSTLFKGITSSEAKPRSQRALRSVIVSVDSMSISERPAAATLQESIRSVIVISALTELAQSALSDANSILKGEPETHITVNIDGQNVVIDTTIEEVLTEDSPLIETLDDCEHVAGLLGDELAVEHMRVADAFWVNTATCLQRLRLTFLEQMKKAAISLPNARTIVPNQTEPALVTLYRETGDSTEITRFVKRNALRHPSFVPGGEPVEVIDD